MADTTTAGTNTADKVASAAEKAAINRAAKAASVSVAAVSEAVPTVVETVELGMEVPAKVVLNQKLIVVTAIIGGAVLGAGIMFGISRLRERKLKEQVMKAIDEGFDVADKDTAKRLERKKNNPIA